MAQEELNNLSQQANTMSQTLQELSGISGDAVQKEKLARLDAATGITNFGAKVNVGVTAIKGLSKVVGEYTSAMYQGKKGYSAMGSTIDTAADALTALGVALLALSGPLGLLVGGLGLAIKAGKGYVNASAEQSDKLYDAYRNMSQVGAAGSEGLQGVYSDMQKLGLGIQDLDKMSKLITENGRDLALMGGSAGMGRQKFAASVESMDQYRTSLMRLGMSQDAINEGVASYIRLESKMGGVQKMTFAQMGAAAREYIVERDALAKVTGMTLKEQEKALEEVRSQEMFRAKLEELRAQGRFEAATELENTYLSIRSVNRTAAQGFADIATGNLRTEAAQKEMRVSQGKTMEVVEKISNNQLKAANAADEVARAHAATATTMGIGLAKTGNYNKVMGDFAGDMNMQAKLIAGGFTEADAKARTEQEKQQAGADKEVNRQVDLINSQRESMNAMQDFVRAGVGPSTTIIKGFNDALNGIVNAVIPGKGAGAAPAGYGAPPAAAAAKPTATKPAAAKPAVATPSAPPRTSAAGAVPAVESRPESSQSRQAVEKPMSARPATATPSMAAAPTAVPAATPAQPAIPPTAAPTQRTEEAREEREQIEKEAAEAAARAKETKTKEDRTKAEEARKQAERARAREEHARKQAGAGVTGPSPVPAVPAPGPQPPRTKEEIYAADAKSLVEKLQQYGITNQYALSAIVATARKESNLDYTKEEAGAAEYLASLNKRGVSYIYKVFPQLGPGGRVANDMGYGQTGVPEDIVRSEWAKGNESFYQMVYGGLSTNKNAGDAFMYRGRGYVQITGRSVYDKVGKEVGLDLVNNPDSITKDKDVAAAALAGYLFTTRGGKDKTLKDLSEFKTSDEALRYVLRTVAGLGHKEAEFDKKGSHLEEQYRKSSQFMDFADKAVKNSKVPSAQDGGIFKGPKSGYAAKLHGEELIAPLDKSSDLMIALETMRANNEMILQSMQQLSALQRRNTDLDKRMLKQAA